MYTYKCGKCGEELSREAYHRDPSRKGHFSICKKCKSKNRNLLSELTSNAKSRAKRKGLEFNLSKSFMEKLNDKQNSQCALTGIELNWVAGSLEGKQRVCPPDRASLDRIDPNKGYTKDNVQLICEFVNRIKGWYPEHDLYEFCELILSNR